eukprot:FR735383.1.p1 GENE.FR735383.1~~FR735383.1.p1  ORF type:complete len:353 (+),score=67.37 FR735383.1:80-1060(+)
MHYSSNDDLGVDVMAGTPPKDHAGMTSKADGKKAPGWSNAVSGGLCAAISRTCVAPLERLRFQMMTDGAKYNNSSVACIRGIVQREGFTKLWAGNGANMIRIIPQNALMFLAKPAIQKSIKPAVPDPALGSLLSGMASGCVSSTAIYPLDYVRLRLTTTPGVYKGLYDGLYRIAVDEGPLALMRGVQYANIWAIPYTAALFGTNDTLKRLANHYNVTMTPILGVCFGAISSMVSTTVGFPLEGARRKLQGPSTGGRPVIYPGMIDCLRQNGRKIGIGGMYVRVGRERASNGPPPRPFPFRAPGLSFKPQIPGPVIIEKEKARPRLA